MKADGERIVGRAPLAKRDAATTTPAQFAHLAHSLDLDSNSAHAPTNLTHVQALNWQQQQQDSSNTRVKNVTAQNGK